MSSSRSSSSRSRSFKRHGSRYKARRRAVDVLFEAEARDVDPVSIVEDRIELSRLPEPPVAPINPYTRTIVAGVAVELDTVDEVISRFLADEWSLERLPAVDRAILRVQCWELLFNPEVPGPVSVVDGVELGSQYSTPVSSPYIHAVLDAVNKNLDGLLAEIAEAQRVAEAVNPETENASGDDGGSVESLSTASYDADVSAGAPGEDIPGGERTPESSADEEPHG